MILSAFPPSAAIAPRIGLGMAALGRPGYINLGHNGDLEAKTVEAMRDQSFAVLDAAWQAGVRYFDAARSYGRGEEFLGDWLRAREIAPLTVAVGSKWGYTYTADWQIVAEKHEVKEHSLTVLRRQWQESQVNVGSYLRLYQIHSATLDSGVFENTEVLTELARLKGEGVQIGLSLSGVEQPLALERALGIHIDGVRLFDAVQATWNLLERSAGAMLAEAHRTGLSIIVKEALANGRLTDRNTDPDFAPKLALLHQQAERLNTSLDGLALAAVLAQSWATVVLSGAATIEQLESNLRAVTVQWDYEAVAVLDQLTEPPADYWATRKALAWN